MWDNTATPDARAGAAAGTDEPFPARAPVMRRADADPAPLPLPRRGPGLALWLALWGVFGLCEAAQSYAAYSARGDPLTWGQALGLGLGLWFGWGVVWALTCRLVR